MFRHYVAICVGSSWYVVVKSRRVQCIAINYALSMLCSLGSLSAMLRSLMELWVR